MNNRENSDNPNRELYFQQIGRLIRQEIRDDIKVGIERPETDYLKKCHNFLFDLCSNLSPKSGYLGGKRKGEGNFNMLWRDMKTEMAELVASTVQSVKTQQMVKNINSAAAEALVRKAMRDAGLEYQYLGQQYRAKVAVKITPSSKLVFHLSYKNISELLPEAVESAKQMKELASRLGKGTAIYKIHQWETWN